MIRGRTNCMRFLTISCIPHQPEAQAREHFKVFPRLRFGLVLGEYSPLTGLSSKTLLNRITAVLSSIRVLVL